LNLPQFKQLKPIAFNWSQHTDFKIEKRVGRVNHHPFQNRPAEDAVALGQRHIPLTFLALQAIIVRISIAWPLTYCRENFTP